METVVCNSPEKLQVPQSNGLLSVSENISVISPPSEEENSNHKINGTVLDDAIDQPNDIDTSKSLENLSQKPLSPTLIEHAFKVVKNLFSPEKSKSKTSNAPSPVTVQQSPCSSPCHSINIPSKPDVSVPEPSIEITENVLKGDIAGMNQLGVVRNSLTLDPHNNTNDSFLTAISLADESFQSTVTHLDENGEILKSEEKLSESLFDDFRNLTLSESLHDTSGVSESYLENTMLKNGSFASDGVKPVNSSNECEEEKLNETQVLNNIATDKVAEPETKSMEENDYYDSLEENLKPKPFKVEESGNECSIINGDCKERDIKNLALEADVQVVEENDKLGDGIEDLSVKDNVSKNSEGTESKPNENGDSLPNEITSQVDNEKIELKKTENILDIDTVRNSISTTTVVLGELESNDLDNVLYTDSKTTALSVSSAEECDVLFEKDADRQEEKENIYCKDRNLVRSPEKKLCKSEGSSPKASRSSRINKSLDCINREKSFNQFSKDEKLSAAEPASQPTSNTSFVKNSETSENIKNVHLSQPELKTILSPSMRKLKNDDLENDIGSKVDEEFCRDQPSPVPVVSQQSYTILNNTIDTSLKRPVIDSSESEGVNLPENSPEKSTDTFLKYSNDIVNDFLEFSSDNVDVPKQSTPILNSTLTLIKSASEKTISRGKVENDKDILNTSNYSEADFLKKAMQIFSADEKPNELSSVNPQSDSQLYISSSSDEKLNSVSQKTFNLDSTWDVPLKDIMELNKTFDEKPVKQTTPKKLKSPGLKKQKLRKSLGSDSSPKLNQTFEKRKELLSNNNFNQTFDKGESPDIGSNQFNQTYDKVTTSPKPKLNQTYEMKSPSPVVTNLNLTFDKKTESPALSSPIPESPLEDLEQNGPEAGVEINKTFDLKIGTPMKKSETDGNKEVKASSERKSVIHHAPPSFSQVSGNDPSRVPEPVNVLKKVAESASDESTLSSLSSNTSYMGNDTVLPVQIPILGNDPVEDLIAKVEKIEMDGSSVQDNESLSSKDDPSKNELITDEAGLDDLSPIFKDDKFQCDPDLLSLIQQQFSSADIEKICTVVDDLSAMKLSSQILKSSKVFDKSSQGSLLSDQSEKPAGGLTPHSLDFLNSIGGQHQGRDLSRVSLYAKFDPLVQTSGGSSLIDFNKEIEALAISENSSQENSVQEFQKLLDISPQKKFDDPVPPLTPLSQKNSMFLKEDETVIKDLQNEVYFLKNLYAEKEKANNLKLETCESQNALLKDKLKEMEEQSKEVDSLRVIIEECFKVISKLSSELETLKCENMRQVKTLTTERDSLLSHLQNTEAAFVQVLSKYEKCKSVIVQYKANETTYKKMIAEQEQKLRESKEKALEEFQKIQDELNQTESNHHREMARIRAQLRKTEKKLDIQE